MAPTKCKMEKTNAGEEVLDIVIPYINNIEDRNSVSLVSRKFFEIDGITRKRVTVHALYCPNPASLSKRFPFIESLTLKGTPPNFIKNGFIIRITPWIQQLALEFRCLKELHIRRMGVHDEDLETLARTRGKDLRSLKISMCEGFSTDGLMHISKYCNKLRTLNVGFYYNVERKDGIWFHQLALNSTVLEKLHVRNMDLSYEDLRRLAKNCCNSLVSLKLGECYLSQLGDAFRYAVRLEHFSGHDCYDEENDLVGFRLPSNMRSLSIKDFPITQYSKVLPFLNHIRKLKLELLDLDCECQCLLFERCPNLEILYSADVCGDKGLQVIGMFCKNLRKLTHYSVGNVTRVGLIAIAKGCTKLECIKVRLGDISNEAIEFVGVHLKNLRKFRMELDKKDGTTLDNGIKVMLMGCSKLQTLDISLLHGGLTDVGLEYIGKYGANLRSLSLTLIGNSNAGLVKLSEGCPRLRKLKLKDCPYSKQVVASCVFNIPSLRYVWVCHRDTRFWTLIRPEFQL